MTKEDVKESSIREKKADKKELGGREGAEWTAAFPPSFPRASCYFKENLCKSREG